MLADADAEGAMHHLEGCIGPRLVGMAGEIGHRERPAQQADGLCESGTDTDRRGEREHGRVGAAQRAGDEYHRRDEEDRAERERPPGQQQAFTAGREGLQDLDGRPPKDVRVVEQGGQGGERGVEEDRQRDQQQPSDDFDAHPATAADPRLGSVLRKLMCSPSASSRTT